MTTDNPETFEEDNGTWNYRVIRKDGFCEIHEVYYNADDAPIAFTEHSCSPCGDSIEELQEDLEYFNQAIELPIFEYDDLCKICIENTQDD